VSGGSRARTATRATGGKKKKKKKAKSKVVFKWGISRPSSNEKGIRQQPGLFYSFNFLSFHLVEALAKRQFNFMYPPHLFFLIFFLLLLVIIFFQFLKSRISRSIMARLG
jgi:hypothetical protein